MALLESICWYLDIFRFRMNSGISVIKLPSIILKCKHKYFVGVGGWGAYIIHNGHILAISTDRMIFFENQWGKAEWVGKNKWEVHVSYVNSVHNI